MPAYPVYRAELNYQNEITADEITVIFNGTTYTVPKDPNGLYGLGTLMDRGTVTGDYPFCIARASDTNYVYVNSDVYHNHNPFTIKIVAEGVTTTPCFDLARGYSCDVKQMVIEESVTTTTQEDYVQGAFSDGSLIDAETIKVTFNGTEYECEQSTLDGGYIYGGFSLTPLPHSDFSQYPFVIMSRAGDGNLLDTEVAGTYSVKVEWTEETITTTPCFKKAVKSIGGDVVYAKMERTVDEDGCTIYTLDITDADLASIIRNGQQLVILEPMSKGGSTNYAMHYPTRVWVDGVSPATPVFRVGSDVGGLGDPVAMVTITTVDRFTLNERLLTLFAYSGTASPRYLEGKMCVSEDPLVVPLNKDISAATTSSPVKSSVKAYNKIANALENGVPVYLQEYTSKNNLLVTAFNGSSMTNATITVNIEKTDGTLGISYSKPITFHFDTDGYAYYPMSAT